MLCFLRLDYGIFLFFHMTSKAALAKGTQRQRLVFHSDCINKLNFKNVVKLYHSYKFDSYWWIHFNVRPISYTHQNLCMTYRYCLSFLRNFTSSSKICVKHRQAKTDLEKIMFLLLQKIWGLQQSFNPNKAA